MSDLIDRQKAIDAMWKALYEYEDKMEKQFIESDDLDVEEWIQHRIFVQNMSDIDRKVILDLPSAEPEIIRCKDCKWWKSSWKYCRYIHFDTDKEFYCAVGERRPDATFK